MEKLKLKKLDKTSNRFPTQWEGVNKSDQKVYIRYRHGVLKVGVGETIDEAVENSMNDPVIEREVDSNSPSNGIMETRFLLEETEVELEE